MDAIPYLIFETGFPTRRLWRGVASVGALEGGERASGWAVSGGRFTVACPGGKEGRS